MNNQSESLNELLQEIKQLLEKENGKYDTKEKQTEISNPSQAPCGGSIKIVDLSIQNGINFINTPISEGLLSISGDFCNQCGFVSFTLTPKGGGMFSFRSSLISQVTCPDSTTVEVMGEGNVLQGDCPQCIPIPVTFTLTVVKDGSNCSFSFVVKTFRGIKVLSTPTPIPANCSTISIGTCSCCTCKGQVAFNDAFATLTEIINGVPTTVSGTSTIRASICPDCNATESFLEYIFNPSSYVIGPFVVSFISDTIGFPTCTTVGSTTVGSTTTLTVSGTGTLIEGGITYTSVAFTLVLTSASTVQLCSYFLLINATLQSPTIPILPGIPVKSTGTVTVPCPPPGQPPLISTCP